MLDTNVGLDDSAPVATFHTHSSFSPNVVAPSLGRLVRGWTVCLDAGAFHWNTTTGDWEYHGDRVAVRTDPLAVED